MKDCPIEKYGKRGFRRWQIFPPGSGIPSEISVGGSPSVEFDTGIHTRHSSISRHSCASPSLDVISKKTHSNLATQSQNRRQVLPQIKCIRKSPKKRWFQEIKPSSKIWFYSVSVSLSGFMSFCH